MANPKRRKCVCGKNYVRKGHNYCIACESARDPLPPLSLRDIDKAIKDNKPKTSQIIFAFKNKVSEQRKNAILREVCLWKEVKSAERVFDDSDVSSVELCVVYVKISSQTGSVVSRLQSLSEIKYAYLPPTKRLK